jgi:transposase
VPALKPGDVVVMDNLRAHYADGVKELLESRGAEPLHLPPYAPELNPIELTWSKLKAILRRIEARTLRTLAGALPHCITEIQPSDLAGYGNHINCGAL